MNETSAPPVQPSPTPAPPSPDAGTAAPPAPPPAAQIVITAQRTERELELEQTLEAERAAKRERELRIAELEDQNFQLKKLGAPPPQKKCAPVTVWDMFDEKD